MNIETIAAWCAPWNDLFSHSKLIAGGVVGIHIMALVLGGGLAIAADRLTLRVPSRDDAARDAQLREVRDVHALVLAGVVFLFLSGILLAAADVETFLPSPIFWLKLTLSALLLVNGTLLTRAERLSSAGVGTWSRVRWLSISSVVLWTATAVVGIVLSNAA